MPKFVVTKKNDAYVLYETLVEAADAEQAHHIADAWSYAGKWTNAGQVEEFDKSDIFLEDVEELKEGDPEPVDHSTIHLTGPERDTILAALRLYQRVRNLPDYIRDIETNNGEHEGLDLEAIDDLCERINQ